MDYIAIILLGFVCGVACVYFPLEKKRRALREVTHAQKEERAVLDRRQGELDAQVQEVTVLRARLQESFDARVQEVTETHARLQEERRQLDARTITFQELQNENAILKRDLRNLDIHVRKLHIDGELRTKEQAAITQRVDELATRYLKDQVKWISASLNANNYAACKQRLLDAIARCRGIGFDVPQAQENELLADLKQRFEAEVRAAFQREEQARIRAQIREEAAREKECKRIQDQIDRERQAIEQALQTALARARDEHDAEVASLRSRLAETEERQRALSQAQLTKAGYVYVISNIGAFGEGVFKNGMTRRLVPDDRVKELGDASVPFPFDVHMMISADNAPTLENVLHRALHLKRLNRTNPRKEFFRTSIDEVRRIVEENYGEVEYVAEPEASEYRQSLSMSDEDQEFIEHVFEEVAEEADSPEIDL